MRLTSYVEFIWYRALAEMRADAARGFLGFAWWLIEPLLYLAAFYLIFGVVFQQRGEGYVHFLLCGLVVWKWFASSVQNASASITRNMGLIYQVYLPKEAFPIIAILTSTIRFAFIFVLLLAFISFSGVPVTLAWAIDIPLLLVAQIVLMLGIGMVAAALVPFVPDLKFVIDNGLLLLFFLSGIFFRFDAIPESMRPYFDLNPMAVLIHEYRRVLIEGQYVDWSAVWPVIMTGACLVLAGEVMLKRWDRVYAKKAFL